MRSSRVWMPRLARSSARWEPTPLIIWTLVCRPSGIKTFISSPWMGLAVTRANGDREEKTATESQRHRWGNFKRKGTEARYKIRLRRGDAGGTRRRLRRFLGRKSGGWACQEY